MGTDDKKTVLLIEDEPDIRSLYSEVLRDAGYRVLEASNGKEALDSAMDNYWDLMLLDIVIPGLDGLGILKRVKETPNLKAKPIILLTNLGSETTIKQSFDLGADGFLIKAEITPDKILNEVSNYLS